MALAANGNARLVLTSEAGEQPNEVTLTLQVTRAEAVSGYHFQVHYDPDVLTWMGTESLQASRFAGSAGAQSIAMQHTSRNSTILLSDILKPESILQGAGELVRLRFKVLKHNLPGRIEITEALISDPTGNVSRLKGPLNTNIRILPDGYALGQNYPNPFNPETVVPFALPEAGRIRLAVYNILGQEVAVLVDAHREAGFHRVVWDGRDALRRQAASSIYFVRLAGNTSGLTRKIQLVK